MCLCERFFFVSIVRVAANNLTMGGIEFSIHRFPLFFFSFRYLRFCKEREGNLGVTNSKN